MVIYGWVEVAPQGWRTALRSWLSLRKSLFMDYGIPVSQELHATEFVNGRGRISVVPPTRFIDASRGNTLWKDLGREVAHRCLATRDCPDIRVGSVYRWTGVTGSAYGR